MPRLFGLVLQMAAAFLYLGGMGWNVSAMPIANAGFLGATIIALAALATAWWLRGGVPAGGSRLGDVYVRYERMLADPAFLFGFALCWTACAVEASRMLPPAETGLPPLPVFAAATQTLLMMLAYIASAWGWQIVARRARWPVAALPSFASLPVLAAGFVAALVQRAHVLQTSYWAIWIVAIGLHLRMLYRNDQVGGNAPLLRATHVGGVWLGAAMLADCLWLGIDRAALWPTAWAEVVFLASIVAVLAALTFWAGAAIRRGGQVRRWPLDRHAIDYAWYAAAPVASLVYAGAVLTALLSPGNADPLPYVPLLNPVDVALCLSLAVLELWRRSVVAADPAPATAATLRGHGAFAALALLAFVVIDTIWLRAAHHLLGVAWRPDALLASFVVQTGLAILWTMLALAAMTVAHLKRQRTLWLAGAGLLGLTVVKLVVVDFTNAGGAARIVAFIVVGLLMLVIGYLAPLPPKAALADTEPQEDAR